MKTLNLTQAQLDLKLGRGDWIEEADAVEKFDHIFSVIRNLRTGNIFFVKIQK